MRNDAISSMMRKTKTILILAIFILASVAHLYTADTQCEWTDVERIVAVGDIHGDYKAFIEILKGTGLLDDGINWTGGKAHLVQIGDVLDRGPDAKKILDLLMKLEKEAKEAGGEAHMLIGNHEEMNIGNIALDREGYVTPSQFVSFLSDRYRKSQEKKFRKQMGGNAPKETESDSSLEDGLVPFWEKIINETKNKHGHPARRDYIENFNKIYGKWIVKQNAVIKINNIIFVHGGISERLSTWKLKAINNRLRLELEDLRRAAMNYSSPRIESFQRRILYAPDGPYWYRDFSRRSEADFTENVDRILDNLKADYMVIAHTPKVIKTEKDMQLFEGRIWIIDTGISELYRTHAGGRLSALVIDNGKFEAWGLDNEK
jgi:hypothetical protein